MDEDRPLFILAGNGPYQNRGCEAIVRGTVKILRDRFPDPQFLCVSLFHNEQQLIRQQGRETDSSITHLRSLVPSKTGMIRAFWKPSTWRLGYQYIFDKLAYSSSVYQEMLPHLENANAVLSIGGDNYSLDYAVPTYFIGLNNLVLTHNRPLAIWGASIGPFSKMPDFERFMSNHLQKVTGIFARESSTVEYLRSIGVTRNVYPVADPAFVMDPALPNEVRAESLKIEKGAVGLNLSPLMAKYVTGGDLEAWARVAADIIWKIASTTEVPVYLVPHVTTAGSDDDTFTRTADSDDYTFMRKATSLIQEKIRNLTLIPPFYTAAETKWIISQTDLFAGARTHATIAALSSNVPTLSFAYSIKAQGINRDIFRHTDYCLDGPDINAATIAERISDMLDNKTRIQSDLVKRIPCIKESAMQAGDALKRIVGDDMNR
jgi:polysaccharide pyruvyl transferase WcaK-like protein